MKILFGTFKYCLKGFKDIQQEVVKQENYLSKNQKKLLQSSKEIKRGKLKEHVLYKLGVASNKEDGKYIKSKKYLIIRTLE